MSADLLEAFGSGNEEKKNSQEPAWPRVENSETLIPGFESLQLGSLPKADPVSSAGRVSNESVVPDLGPSSGDVLFDAAAGEFSEDEDFGDFETGEADGNGISTSGATKQDVRPMALESSPFADLLSPGPADTHPSPNDVQILGDALPIPSATTRPPQPEKLTEFEGDDDWGDLVESAAPASQPGQADIDEDWGDFADVPAPGPAPGSAPPMLPQDNAGRPLEQAPKAIKAPQTSAPPQDDANDDWFDFGPVGARDTPVKVASTVSEPAPDIRPTNVPPPSTLLQVLPKIFDRIYNSITRQSTAAQPVQELFTVFSVAGRIIAGRSLRWKRDTRLAQSTRIGPAGAGKGGGMKLTALNKSESLKEERDVAEVVDAWVKKSHFFSSALQKQGYHQPSLLALNKNVRAKRLGPTEGGLTALHACALCGLKRDERIPNVDVEINDSFGEWWIEYWGHASCKTFWELYRSLLDQR